MEKHSSLNWPLNTKGEPMTPVVQTLSNSFAFHNGVLYFKDEPANTGGHKVQLITFIDTVAVKQSGDPIKASITLGAAFSGGKPVDGNAKFAIKYSGAQELSKFSTELPFTIPPHDDGSLRLDIDKYDRKAKYSIIDAEGRSVWYSWVQFFSAKNNVLTAVAVTRSGDVKIIKEVEFDFLTNTITKTYEEISSDGTLYRTMHKNDRLALSTKEKDGHMTGEIFDDDIKFFGQLGNFTINGVLWVLPEAGCQFTRYTNAASAAAMDEGSVVEEGIVLHSHVSLLVDGEVYKNVLIAESKQGRMFAIHSDGTIYDPELVAKFVAKNNELQRDLGVAAPGAEERKEQSASSQKEREEERESKEPEPTKTAPRSNVIDYQRGRKMLGRADVKELDRGDANATGVQEDYIQKLNKQANTRKPGNIEK